MDEERCGWGGGRHEQPRWSGAVSQPALFEPAASSSRSVALTHSAPFVDLWAHCALPSSRILTLAWPRAAGNGR